MLTILCLFSMVLSLNAFQFNEDGEFTLLQLTDFHSCEKESRDLKTWKLWDMLISKAPPDLVILSGDAVSGYAGRYENGTVMDGFFKSCWTNFSSYFENKGLHYAYILGNHDDEGDYNRSQIIELDKTSPFSVLGMSESTQMNNTGNYWIPIYSRKNSSAIAVIIWMFDTHDTNCSGIPSSWGCIEHDQLEWYDRESKKIKDLYGTNIQHIAYLHIPIPEYMALYNTEDIYSLYGEPVSCAKVNTGFFSHVLQNGDISAMFVGHDHQNDFGGYYHGVELVYGRKSGYGGYGNIAGGRIVNFKEVEGPDGSTIVTRNHYVIQEDGSIEQNSPLKARKGAIQASCVAAMNRNLIHEESDDEKKMIIEEFLGFSWGKEERKQFLIERIYEDKN